jgi:hypothetical protein
MTDEGVVGGCFETPQRLEGFYSVKETMRGDSPFRSAIVRRTDANPHQAKN